MKHKEYRLLKMKHNHFLCLNLTLFIGLIQETSYEQGQLQPPATAYHFYNSEPPPQLPAIVTSISHILAQEATGREINSITEKRREKETVEETLIFHWMICEDNEIQT